MPAPIRLFSALPLCLLLADAANAQTNIDPANDGSRYAWGENVGWFNAKPLGATGPGVQVTNASLTGWIWGENIGWVSLSCLNRSNPCGAVAYGVTNTSAGQLSGYAWSENAGWINFRPFGGGVFIDGNGDFQGTAWGENIGWIVFRGAGFGIRTSWCPAVDVMPPASTASGFPIGWTNQNVTVSFTAVDNRCGGVREISTTLDTNPPVVTLGAAASVTVVAEGDHTLAWHAVDTSNNAEAPRLQPVRIDKTPPTITITRPNGSYGQNAAVTAAYGATDALSGVTALSGDVANGAVINTALPGTFRFNVMATDLAGNLATTVSTYSIAVPPPAGPPGTVATIAGTGVNTQSAYCSADGVATQVLLFNLGAVGADPAGNAYFYGDDHRIRRVDAAGNLVTVAGAADCLQGNTGNGGSATAAQIFLAKSLAFDAQSNLYFADSGNCVIRQVDRAGIIRRYAGIGPIAGSGGCLDFRTDPTVGDGGAATSAVLSVPEGVAVDVGGNVYIADSNNCRVRKVAPGINGASGTITTIAGNNNGCNHSGDGGQATVATLQPRRVVVDGTGNVFVLTEDNPTFGVVIFRVRRIDAATGIITTVAGGGTGPAGSATATTLATPTGLALDAAGILYVSDRSGLIYRVDTAANAISTVAGNANGSPNDGVSAGQANLGNIQDIAIDRAGNLLLTDGASARVRRIAAAAPPTVATLTIDANTAQSFLDSLVTFDGNLVLNASARTGLSLPNLTRVTGNFVVTGNAALTSFAAPNLARVDGRLEVSGNPLLTAVNFPALTNVGGDATVSGNTSATNVSAPALTSAGGSVTITGNTAATSVSASALVSAGGNVTITGNTSATSVSAPALTSAGGSVTITGNTSATSVSASALTSAGGSVTITGNTAATNVSASALVSAGGSVTITGNNSTNTAVTIGPATGTAAVTGSLTVETQGQANPSFGNVTVGGSTTITTGAATTVSAQTSGGSTAVKLVNAAATMQAVLPTGAFASRVAFSVTHLDPATLGAVPGITPAATAVTVDPVAAYQFTFGIPTLNSPATLTFDVDVTALSAAEQTSLLTALAANNITLAVLGDAPGSVYQTFTVCTGAQVPTAGGCVQISKLDANGVPTAGTPAIIRVDAVAGHFSVYAVVIVTTDSTPPVFSNIPAPPPAEATGPTGAVVNYTAPTATDAVSGVRPVSCAPSSGSTFALGTTTVTCTATDAAGNTATATFTVKVQDTTPPVIAGMPANISVTASAPTVVTWIAPTASDAVSGNVPVTCTPASGSTFQLGTTTVSCTATDAALNTATAPPFTVTVSVPTAGNSKTLCTTLSRPRGLDLDTFDFTGSANETVTVRLVADPAAPAAGGRAALTLYGPGVLRLDASALPNQVAAKLPRAAVYHVTVAQLPLKTGAFKGPYCVSLQSSGNAAQSLVQR